MQIRHIEDMLMKISQVILLEFYELSATPSKNVCISACVRLFALIWKHLFQSNKHSFLVDSFVSHFFFRCFAFGRQCENKNSIFLSLIESQTKILIEWQYDNVYIANNSNITNVFTCPFWRCDVNGIFIAKYWCAVKAIHWYCLKRWDEKNEQNIERALWWNEWKNTASHLCNSFAIT